MGSAKFIRQDPHEPVSQLHGIPLWSPTDVLEFPTTTVVKLSSKHLPMVISHGTSPPFDACFHLGNDPAKCLT